jgi:hypothetical protein
MAYKLLDEQGAERTERGKALMGSDLALDPELKVLDPDRRIVKVVVSSDRQDRDGDRINQKGMLYDAHIRNPVVLYAHDWGGRYLPIGKMLDFSLQERQDPSGELYHVTVETHQFNPPGAYELSDAAWKLVEFGSLVATSIGFLPLRSVVPQGDKERQEMGLGRWGVWYEEAEKLETSWVPIPSNRDAVREALGKGIITRPEVRLLFPAHSEGLLSRKSWPGAELELKGAIPYQRHPLADEEAEWDGPAEVAAAEVEDLKVMCAWYDAENPDIKQSYKLPHHRASDHYTVWRGVAAAMAALMGSRGGVDIPQDDRRAVYNHLARHYKDFEKEPPEFDSAEKGDDLVGMLTQACLGLLQERALGAEADGLEETAKRILRIMEV